MKKYITFLLLVLCCSFVLYTEVSAGNIKVETTLDKKIEVQYTKIGEWENGTLVLKEPFMKSGIELQSLEKSMDIHGMITKLEKMKLRQKYLKLAL